MSAHAPMLSASTHPVSTHHTTTVLATVAQRPVQFNAISCDTHRMLFVSSNAIHAVPLDQAAPYTNTSPLTITDIFPIPNTDDAWVSADFVPFDATLVPGFSVTATTLHSIGTFFALSKNGSLYHFLTDKQEPRFNVNAVVDNANLTHITAFCVILDGAHHYRLLLANHSGLIHMYRIQQAHTEHMRAELITYWNVATVAGGASEPVTSVAAITVGVVTYIAVGQSSGVVTVWRKDGGEAEFIDAFNSIAYGMNVNCLRWHHLRDMTYPMRDPSMMQPIPAALRTAVNTPANTLILAMASGRQLRVAAYLLNGSKVNSAKWNVTDGSSHVRPISSISFVQRLTSHRSYLVMYTTSHDDAMHRWVITANGLTPHSQTLTIDADTSTQIETRPLISRYGAAVSVDKMLIYTATVTNVVHSLTARRSKPVALTLLQATPTPLISDELPLHIARLTQYNKSLTYGAQSFVTYVNIDEPHRAALTRRLFSLVMDNAIQSVQITHVLPNPLSLRLCLLTTAPPTPPLTDKQIPPVTNQAFHDAYIPQPFVDTALSIIRDELQAVPTMTDIVKTTVLYILAALISLLRSLPGRYRRLTLEDYNELGAVEAKLSRLAATL